MTKIIVELSEKAHRNLILAKSDNHDKNYEQTVNRFFENLNIEGGTAQESILNRLSAEIFETMKDDPIITNILMNNEDPLPKLTKGITNLLKNAIKEAPTSGAADDW